MIVTKSFFNSLNLKDLFRVPVIYCVGGIFPNSLDKYFYDLSDNEIKTICNKNVIQQIKNSDFVFVNSSHTRDILKEKFKVDLPPTLDIEKSLWHEFTKDYRLGSSIQGHIDTIVDNKKYRNPLIGFTADLQTLDKMLIDFKIKFEELDDIKSNLSKKDK